MKKLLKFILNSKQKPMISKPPDSKSTKKLVNFVEKMSVDIIQEAAYSVNPMDYSCPSSKETVVISNAKNENNSKAQMKPFYQLK